MSPPHIYITQYIFNMLIMVTKIFIITEIPVQPAASTPSHNTKAPNLWYNNLCKVQYHSW